MEESKIEWRRTSFFFLKKKNPRSFPQILISHMPTVDAKSGETKDVDSNGLVSEELRDDSPQVEAAFKGEGGRLEHRENTQVEYRIRR
jgi:hypothetical protein